MMLKVAVTDIGQLTDFDHDRQKPDPCPVLRAGWLPGGSGLAAYARR
jgi:hypothetical protein